MNYQDTSVLPSGTKVDQYVISSMLGRGGFGITYLVHDPGLQKDFALKEFFPEDLVRREGTSIRFAAKPNSESDYKWGLKKFYDEARLLAQFNHSNIVNVRRVFEANNSAYMLLDFIKGSTLEKWLQGLDSPPTQEELDLIAAPLLNALELVHENRTWHLDVSPDNIMIRSADGAPILLDFGASRFEIKQHSQLVSALVFKSGYSAPEQYMSAADAYGPWTDIYAVAATLYRAVSGSRPTESTARQLKVEHKSAVQAAKGKYRDKFLKAIDWGLNLAPQDRPQSIGAWRARLLDGITGSVPASRTRMLPSAGGTKLIGQTISAPSRWSRRFDRRTTAAAVGTFGLLLAVGAVLDQVAPSQLNPYGYLKQALGGSTGALTRCGGLLAGDCWGVIVEKGGSVFARVESSNRDQAEKAAVTNCENALGRGNCRVIASISKKECWALAEVPTNIRNWRHASGGTLESAKSLATAECERSFAFCRVAMTFCADGSNTWRLGN